MIRQLTPRERATWNLEQPGARVTTDLQAENSPFGNIRRHVVAGRAIEARRRAEIHAAAAKVADEIEERVTRMLGYSPRQAERALRGRAGV